MERTSTTAIKDFLPVVTTSSQHGYFCLFENIHKNFLCLGVTVLLKYTYPIRLRVIKKINTELLMPVHFRPLQKFMYFHTSQLLKKRTR